MTRAFGDVTFKSTASVSDLIAASERPKPKRERSQQALATTTQSSPVVSCLPSMTLRALPIVGTGASGGGNSVPLRVVLASDGLWDVIGADEAMDMVSHGPGESDSNTGLLQTATAVTLEAERRTKDTLRGDNITIVIVDLS